jgi:uroporphyrinogen III methyltransferase/synthase
VTAEEGAVRRGRVFLVGAGPGDPDLVTVRGAEALRQADVVLYDELAPDALLDLAPCEAIRINVGRRGHDAPTRSQAEIQALLLEHARQGRTVVRLKGGDAYVFGRGGEEASACVAAGVPIEVVPGVTSALAAPAYAGIPLTDRRHAASFAVVTGHKDPTRVARATRWAELGRAVDTLVILMGMRNLPSLVAAIVEGGRDPATPAAAVMNGGLPDQRVVEAPLGELPRRVAEAGLGAPAVVVVGDVVRLREELAWWERQPLFGTRVLVTRARAQARELCRVLRAAGSAPVLVPLLALAPPADPAELDRALERVSSYDAVVFTSANAVRFFSQRARGRGVEPSALGARVFCVGRETARAALDEGLPLHGVPGAGGRGDAESLLDEIAGWLDPAGRRFLLPRSEIARDALREGLVRAGARVDAVVAYRNLEPPVDAVALRKELASGALDALTFASPSAVRRFAALLDPESREAASRCIVAAIGGTTAEAVRGEGLPVHVVPPRPGARELVAALAAHVAGLRGGPRPRTSRRTSRKEEP